MLNIRFVFPGCEISLFSTGWSMFGACSFAAWLKHKQSRHTKVCKTYSMYFFFALPEILCIIFFAYIYSMSMSNMRARRQQKIRNVQFHILCTPGSLYIDIQTGHILSLRTEHLRHPQKKIICFCQKNIEHKKRDELRQKKGTALKSKLHCAELKKPKNAYELDASGSRRFSKKTCPESTQNTGFREGMSFWPTVLSEPVWIYIYIYQFIRCKYEWMCL